ncbi:MAG: SDR family oxidoreductase [Acidobacteria bacterium]|nr:MAG: SDR family oxidoreductase [Acidobacteriota bacterium]
MEQILLITGSSGIAEATALLAGREDYKVFIVGLDESQCRDLSARIPGSGHFTGDLREPAAVTGALGACLNTFGRIDAVFNAAGVSGRQFGDGPVHECSVEGWDKTIEGNAKPAFLMCRAAVRYWLEAGRGGTILNMASVLAFSPEPSHFSTHAYAASKGAIISMSSAMAAHYVSDGIRVNVIAPALVKTPMSARAQADPDIVEFIRQKQPLSGGFLEAADVAETALFLLSGRSRQMTGQVVAIDGGWSITG